LQDGGVLNLPESHFLKFRKKLKFYLTPHKLTTLGPEPANNNLTLQYILVYKIFPNLISLITLKVMAMDIKFGLHNSAEEEPSVKAQRTVTKPCLRCQYGIFDVPVDGKLNCLEAGTSKVKLFTRKEVEEMTFCDRRVHWAKMDLKSDEEKDNSALKMADEILGRR
jgi:hypothetical protein